ncbi:HVA22-like protein k [Linum grandiflorum]
MAFPAEVGLQLLLYPLNSNIVLRTACCSVGIALPVYTTFKAIERKDPDEQKKCLVYWAAFGAFSVAEVFTDKIISWFPMYYHAKFAFLIWLQLPSMNGTGATVFYSKYLRPFLLRHQVRLDHITEIANGLMAKFIIAHESEFRLAKVIFMKTLASVRETINPVEGRTTGGAIEGPSGSGLTEESLSDDEDE